MKDKIVEESILFVSVFKWIALASGVGVIIGITTALFLKILQASITYVAHYPYYFYFLPLGLFLCAIITRYVAGEAKGYGTEKVIEAVHKQSGKIRAIVIPVKLAATVLTASVGGSVGQIGPCAQIGAGMSSFTSDLLRFDETDRKKLVICGISAGFAAVLGAPIAGAIFGVEVLFVGSILYEVLLPSFIAGIISYHTASLLGINYFHHSIYMALEFSETFFLVNVVIGIFFGLCAIFIIETSRMMNSFFAKIRIWEPLKGFLGGVILVILASIFSDRCLGLGLDSIQETLRGVRIAPETFIMKTVFTAVTFAAGGSGGIIAPIMFIGATAGSFLGDVLGTDRAIIGAIGFVSVLAGAANVPVAMSILAIELFGKGVGTYAAVACVISFLVTGHRSIFPTQIIAMKKSSSVELKLGQELCNISTKYKFRPKGLIGRGVKLKNKLRKHEKEDRTE